jgi:hypothetical protein
MYHTEDKSCGEAWALCIGGMLKDSVYEAHHASDDYLCVNVKSFSLELPFLNYLLTYNILNILSYKKIYATSRLLFKTKQPQRIFIRLLHAAFLTY